MGHANIGNLSDLWINLLYARGKLTIGQAVAVAAKRGETLHASEDDYDADSGMVGMGIEYCCNFLSCDAATALCTWGWHGAWDGPFIEAILEVDCWMPRRFKPDTALLNLLAACKADPDDADYHGVAGDKIEELGFPEWAAYVRDLPGLRGVHERWRADTPGPDEDWWERLDRIPWRFCQGKRTLYRTIPRLTYVSN